MMRYCPAPGCTSVVRRGYCPAHWRLEDQHRGTATARGYSKRWSRRARAFRDRYPLCGMRPLEQAPVYSLCHELGVITAGTCVDHVIPHRGDPTLMWDELGNWQTLCDACHARKTLAGF